MPGLVPKEQLPFGALLLLAAVACSGPTENGNPPAIRVIGPGITDTALADRTLALQIGQRTGARHVRFDVGGDLYLVESVFLGPNGEEIRSLSQYLETITDGAGRVAVRLQMGSKAGDQYLRVTVPSLHLVDSVRLTALPGALARVSAEPLDSVLLPGESFQLRVKTMDQSGNPRTGDPFTLRVINGPIEVAGSIVKALAAGTGAVQVSIPGDSVTVYLNVAPDLMLSGIFDKIRIFRTNGTGARVIFNTPVIADGSDWSPDGQLLVANWQAQLHVVGLDGTHRVLDLAPDPAVEPSYNPRFSADGQWIYYSRRGSDGFQVRRVHPDGLGDTLVVTGAAALLAPAPSPDGTKVAYTASGNQVRILDLNSGASTLLVDQAVAPAWSPTGEIAFVDATTGSVQGIRSDGSGLRTIAPAAPGGSPRWSPDGRWLLWRGDEFDLLDTTTGAIVRLRFTTGWNAPAWRPR